MRLGWNHFSSLQLCQYWLSSDVTTLLKSGTIRKSGLDVGTPQEFGLTWSFFFGLV